MVSGAVTAGRRAAEALMTETFTAYAHTTTTVDGLKTKTWVAQYETPGKVAGRSLQGGDSSARTIDVGGVERVVVEGGIHIPLDADLPEIGWELVCTATGSTSDPSLVGRRWRVVDVPAKSHATARRLDVVEVPA